VRDRLGLRFEVPVVTVAGTNGKGSTCAMLEAIALQAGWRVGLYSKPHLVHFEERCRIDGESGRRASCCRTSRRWRRARRITLTWFEFTTLSSCARWRSAAGPGDPRGGLGGRLDAVNAIDADCVVSPASTSTTSRSWARTARPSAEKAGHRHAAGEPAIVATRCRRTAWWRTASASAPTCGWWGATSTTAATASSGAGPAAAAAMPAWPTRRCAAPTSCSMRRRAGGVRGAARRGCPITAQAVRTGLALVELPGRFQVVPGQPALVLDVAHNPQAVAALARNLDADGLHPAHARRVRRHARQGHPRCPGATSRRWWTDWYLCDLPTGACRAWQRVGRSGIDTSRSRGRCKSADQLPRQPLRGPGSGRCPE
jgi:dihydrofolate synthase/folylpolyglutamate synthase